MANNQTQWLVKPPNQNRGGTGAMGDTQPVNPSKQPKGTVFGAPTKRKQKKMLKALGRNYS